MSYHLLNVETGDYIYIDDNVWISALETAKDNYWQPGGTIYDLEYCIDDDCEFIIGRTMIIFTIMQIAVEQASWDGSYTEKRNQVVDYEDTLYLADCLKGTDAPPELIEFIQKGSFRICSD